MRCIEEHEDSNARRGDVPRFRVHTLGPGRGKPREALDLDTLPSFD